jgi:hypothetical protein
MFHSRNNATHLSANVEQHVLHVHGTKLVVPNWWYQIIMMIAIGLENRFSRIKALSSFSVTKKNFLREGDFSRKPIDSVNHEVTARFLKALQKNLPLS